MDGQPEPWPGAWGHGLRFGPCLGLGEGTTEPPKTKGNDHKLGPWPNCWVRVARSRTTTQAQNDQTKESAEQRTSERKKQITCSQHPRFLLNGSAAVRRTSMAGSLLLACQELTLTIATFCDRQVSNMYPNYATLERNLRAQIHKFGCRNWCQKSQNWMP